MISWLSRIWLTPSARVAPETPPTEDDVPLEPHTVWSVFVNVNEWVKHAETKLGVVLAFLGVLAAGLITLVIEVGRPSIPMLWIEALTGAFLLLAAGAATLGLLPQFAHERDESKANPLYYGDVHRHLGGQEDYADHLRATLRDEDRVVNELARQIVANSAVAVRKYTWANRAIFLGFLSFLGTMAVVAGLVLCW